MVKRRLFLFHLLLIGNGKCRLNIIPPVALVAYKINFVFNFDQLAVLAAPAIFNDAHVNIEAAHQKFVINNVFKYVRLLLLTEI